MTLALDWVAVSSIVTAAATLVLAIATFASVRSANRAARAAERSLLAGLRPLLAPSRLDDQPQKVGFMDDKWFLVPGGGGVAEATDEAVYLAIAVRTSAVGSRSSTVGTSFRNPSSVMSTPRRSSSSGA